MVDLFKTGVISIHYLKEDLINSLISLTVNDKPCRQVSVLCSTSYVVSGLLMDVNRMFLNLEDISFEIDVRVRLEGG